eukprot:6013744-Pyramimonas_sp.AAC.1
MEGSDCDRVRKDEGRNAEGGDSGVDRLSEVLGERFGSDCDRLCGSRGAALRMGLAMAIAWRMKWG